MNSITHSLHFPKKNKHISSKADITTLFKNSPSRFLFER